MISLTAKQIKKYDKYSVSKLIKKCQTKFNAFIRERDKGKKCVSCPTGEVEQASHYYSAGHYSALRFEEDNVNGSCLRCNYFLSGNLIEYRKELEKRIGIERLKALDEKAAIYKRNRSFKWDRITLIWKLENDFKQIK